MKKIETFDEQRAHLIELYKTINSLFKTFDKINVARKKEIIRLANKIGKQNYLDVFFAMNREQIDNEIINIRENICLCVCLGIENRYYHTAYLYFIKPPVYENE